ncbi:MAG: hypothetical protein L0287_10015 [Anaerolineae bacterium]|nr:hypothetical protein [Anaerolineae bacterium]
MRRITNLWTSGTGGKLLIIFSSLFTCCISCICLSLIIPPSSFPTTPTADANAVQTYIVETANALAALNSPTSASTLTSIPTSTDLPTPTAAPVLTQVILPTDTPLPTVTIVVIIPATNPPAGGAVCSCSADLYNCNLNDFSGRSAAQACYEYCISVGAGDIHGLDGDNNGLACEGL